jgi:hypothetical protein
MTFVGEEGGCTRSACGSSVIRRSDRKDRAANEVKTCHAGPANAHTYEILIESAAYHRDLLGATLSLRTPAIWNLRTPLETFILG